MLRPCIRCGRTDPSHMFGLLTVWFGPLAELSEEPGYFYLCPDCHAALIAPHLEDIYERLRRAHPSATDAEPDV